MGATIDLKRLQQFGSLELIARQVVEGFITGLHKSPFHGFSVEFAEHRAYNTGESVRYVDWKLFGRTDKMFVKRFEEETNLRCQIVIDNSSSMYFPVMDELKVDKPNKITFSVYAAAAMIELLRKQRDAFGLSIFSSEIELATGARSTTVHARYLFSEMEKMLVAGRPKVRKSTSVAESLHRIAEMIHKRSLVVIFSDMFDQEDDPGALFSALQHLRHNKHEVVLFHVTDKSHELEFRYDNRPYRFVDLENGEEIKLNPHDVRKDYTRAVDSYRKELMLRCGSYRIDFVEADISRGFEQILLPYLVKRSKMF
ncbi:MAG: DUF58 domain-containing protein [Bacteroidetes bacterium]|nr:DUF58 domain-containing protein [Bacteroidota bacterium]